MSMRLNKSPEDSSIQEVWEETPARDFAALRSLKRELLEELRTPNPQGQAPTPEELLQRWPQDPKNDPDVASVLFEDFLQRRLRGEEPSKEEYDERFPEHADSLAGLFANQAVLRSMGGPSNPSGLTLSLPVVGEEVFHFRLCQELGRGAFARVFLAEQVDLAGRPVVLKISGISGSEPQTLAQLQHTHIVPIYSVHEDERAGLRAVCMPYFGGASLSQVLQPFRDEGKLLTQGVELVEALAGVESRYEPTREKDEGATEAPALQLFRSTTYLRTAVWIVARLAEGLQHAHQRGVLHRDIKPSNILLGSDGQPMLLDFNLSHDLNSELAQASATLGGTVAYMSPEHLRAMFTRDAALARMVDHRADLYSLGMVLFEMLAGQGPFQQSGSYSLLPVVIEAMALERSKNVPSLRQRRADIPWSLESILRKCLAPLPLDRYQHAQQLAEDLDAFLTDAPLRHAPEMSQRERLRKWARRHPRLTSSVTVGIFAAGLLIAAGAGLVGIQQHLTQARERLVIADAHQRKLAFEKGTVRTFSLLNTIMANPAADQPEQARTALLNVGHLREGMEVCEETLGQFKVLHRDDWQQGPAWLRLEPEDRRRLAEDVRELLLLLASARVEAWQRDPQTVPSAQTLEEVVQQALDLLDRAEKIPDLPRSPALGNDRADYLLLLGKKEESQQAAQKAAAIPPSSARDHYLLAIFYSRNRSLDDAPGRNRGLSAAVNELDKALRLNDRHYWSWMQRGLCHLELGHPDLAAADFGACIGLWSEPAWGYFHRGLALYRQNHKARAIDDYTAALQRDPTLVQAYINRGVAQLELLRNQEALADFDRAGELGHEDAQLHVSRGMALERLERGKEADAAFNQAWPLARDLPRSVRLRMRCAYAFAIARRQPSEAEKAFQDIIDEDHSQVQALYGLAMLVLDRKPSQEPIGPISRLGVRAMEYRHSEEAIQLFTQALRIDPEFTDALRFRAVLLARRGDVDQALVDINGCLGKEPRSGITLYAAACVAARIAGHSRGWNAEDARKKALAFLQEAFAEGYGRDKAATDPDLASIRRHPEFEKLLRP